MDTLIQWVRGRFSARRASGKVWVMLSHSHNPKESPTQRRGAILFMAEKSLRIIKNSLLLSAAFHFYKSRFPRPKIVASAQTICSEIFLYFDWMKFFLTLFAPSSLFALLSLLGLLFPSSDCQNAFVLGPLRAKWNSSFPKNEFLILRSLKYHCCYQIPSTC